MTKAIKFSIYAVITFIGILSISNCSVNELAGDLSKDLTLSFDTDFLRNTVSIQVFDAADNAKIIKNATVTIGGRDKDKIYSLMGEKKIELIGGVIALATKPVDAPTEYKSLEFTLTISAPNYLTQTQSFSLKTSKNSALIYESLKLTNVTALPDGASITNTSFNTEANLGTAKQIKINTPLSNGKIENAEISIPTGTKLFAKDGSELSGNVTVGFVHFDSRNKESIETLPGGIAPKNVIDAQTGQNLGKSIMIPAGWYSLELNVGNKIVDHFSQPIDVVAVIDPNMKHPTLGRKIQAGDELKIMSLSPGSDTWVLESSAKVEYMNDKTVLKFKQNHLSSWGYFWYSDTPCEYNVTISSNLPNPTIGNACSISTYNFKYEIYNAYSEELIVASGMSTFGNGVQLPSFSNLEGNLKLRILKADNTWYVYPGTINCGASTVNLSSDLPKPNTVAVSCNISGVCSGDINTILKPSAVIWYKNLEETNPTWKQLTYIDKGQGCASNLIVGNRYDFGIFINTGSGDGVLSIAQELGRPVQIPQGDTTIVVNSPVYGFNHTFDIKKVNNSQYILDYPNFALPPKVCNEIDKRFSVFVK